MGRRRNFWAGTPLRCARPTALTLVLLAG